MNAPRPVLPRRKLPIGIQNLRQMREGGHYYVDKTGMAIDLIESGKSFFLSRPRRFGKSLLVDTIKALFEGQQALFEGLRPSRAGTGRHAMRSSASASPTGCCATAPSWTGASATSCA